MWWCGGLGSEQIVVLSWQLCGCCITFFGKAYRSFASTASPAGVRQTSLCDNTTLMLRLLDVAAVRPSHHDRSCCPVGCGLQPNRSSTVAKFRGVEESHITKKVRQLQRQYVSFLEDVVADIALKFPICSTTSTLAGHSCQRVVWPTPGSIPFVFHFLFRCVLGGGVVRPLQIAVFMGEGPYWYRWEYFIGLCDR